MTEGALQNLRTADFRCVEVWRCEGVEVWKCVLGMYGCGVVTGLWMCRCMCVGVWVCVGVCMWVCGCEEVVPMN